MVFLAFVCMSTQLKSVCIVIKLIVHYNYQCQLLSVGFFNPFGVKPQLHIHGFGSGRATVHPDLSNRGASA